jgi:hypothetical protein
VITTSFNASSWSGLEISARSLVALPSGAALRSGATSKFLGLRPS